MPTIQPSSTCLFLLLWLASMPALLAEEAPKVSDIKTEIEELRNELQEINRTYRKKIESLEGKLQQIEEPQEADEPFEPDADEADEPPAPSKESEKIPADELEALRREAEAAAEDDADREPSESEVEAEPTTAQRTLTALNPRLTVFGDALGRIDDRDITNEEGETISDRFSLREVELDFRADVDPFAKGVVIAGFEEEGPNEYHAAIEEGYATFETLPWNLRAKAGRFRTGFGQINKLHVHDLPQPNFPLPVRTFLGEEGDTQNGLSVSYLAPPLGDNSLELEFQLLNGENDAVLAGDASRSPAYLGRAKIFRDLTENQYLEIGGSHLFGFNDPGNRMQTHLSGLDILYKWTPVRRSRDRSFVFQSELFHLTREQAGGHIDSLGAYAYAQYQPWRRWYFGLRGDYSELADADSGDAWSLSPYVSFYTTEFLRTRLAYEHLEGRNGPVDSVFLQLTFIFGSHPVEPYWFNQ